MKLPDQTIKEKIDTLMDESNALFDKQNYPESIKFLELAWEALPESKGIYDDSFHIAWYLSETYLLIEDFKKAEEWANIVFQCVPGRQDIGEREFLAGKVAFESGNFQEAKKYFSIADEKSEGRCFENEDDKYIRLIRNG